MGIPLPQSIVTSDPPPTSCPSCTSVQVAPIRYGRIDPGHHLVRKAIAAGRYVLGGDRIPRDAPTWKCLSCGKTGGTRHYARYPKNRAAHALAQAAIHHIFGALLAEIRAERSTLGHRAEFELIFLVEAHCAPAEVARQIIQHFEAGEPMASLKELLPDPISKPPHAGKSLTLVQHQEPLLQILEALYSRGEHDTSFVDYHRPDATLLHIRNVHGPRT